MKHKTVTEKTDHESASRVVSTIYIVQSRIKPMVVWHNEGVPLVSLEAVKKELAFRKHMNAPSKLRREYRVLRVDTVHSVEITPEGCRKVRASRWTWK